MGIAAMVLVGAALAAGSRADDGQPPEVVRLDGETRVQIANTAGEVGVREGTGRQVVVHATVRQWEAGCTYTQPDDVTWRVASEGGARCEVVLLVELPKKTGLDLDLGAGDVYLSGGDGGAAVKVGAGDVGLKRVRGPIAIDVGAGNVEGDALSDVTVSVGTGAVTLGGLVRAAQVAVGSGGVALGYESAPQGTIDVSVGVGDALVDLPRGTQVDAQVSAGIGEGQVALPVTPGAGTQVRVQAAMGRAVVE